MISRRNIRVKVMQALFAVAYNENSNEEIATPERIKKDIRAGLILFRSSLDTTSGLFYFLLSMMGEICFCAKTEADKRAHKFQPTAADKTMSTKIAENKLISDLWKNEDFQELREKFQLPQQTDPEWVRKLFRKLEGTEEYKNYILTEEHTVKSEKSILLFIWKEILLNNESFISRTSDLWDNWEADHKQMEILVENFIQKPKAVNFKEFISEDKMEYAEELLKTVVEKDGYLTEVIQGKLKNWELERVASIDLILLKMGISEFLYFPTIPVKVTINEFIDIAKNYSTEQSGQFINGVLDNLKREFTEQNKLRKVERVK